MSQEGVMNRDRDMFIKSAVAVDITEHGSLADHTKDKLMGSKTRYQFTCQNCRKTTVTTENAYEDKESVVKQGVRREAISQMRRTLASSVRSIPYVGHFLASLVYNLAPSSTRMASATNFKGKMMAFEEVESQFQSCKECGKYVCNKCHKNGICTSCAEQDAPDKSDN